jgi:hypothetical protein
LALSSAYRNTSVGWVKALRNPTHDIKTTEII